MHVHNHSFCIILTNTKLGMMLRNTWKQIEDIHGMDFVLDLAQVSIFSSNPGDKALILWFVRFSVDSDLIKKKKSAN